MKGCHFLPNPNSAAGKPLRRARYFVRSTALALYRSTIGPLYIRRMAQHVDRYIPAETNGGWGFASFVIVLALVLIAGVAYIHNKTYKHPTDVTARAIGGAPAAPAAH
jgi:cbb3-type cytochrome oxidase subunit 3